MKLRIAICNRSRWIRFQLFDLQLHFLRKPLIIIIQTSYIFPLCLGQSQITCFTGTSIMLHNNVMCISLSSDPLNGLSKSLRHFCIIRIIVDYEYL